MATAQPVLEHELVDGATDGITRAAFYPRENPENYLLTTSWDKYLRIYGASSNKILGKFDGSAPLLDGVFHHQNSNIVFTAGLDKHVQMWDITKGTKTILGSHNDGVRSVLFDNNRNSVVSGGWDGIVNMWDVRSPKNVCSATLPGKIFSMDLNNQRLVVGTNERQIFVFDLRNLSKPEQHRESSLSHQTRAIKCNPNQKGYIVSSIEGRISVEFFDPSESVQALKYAFKCHRKQENNKQILYPVNALAFHPNGTFASGGCDGYVLIWDGEAKKRICQYSPYQTSISSLDFNSSGRLLAIASSYTFEQGDKPHPRDSVFIRTVNPSEVTPKKKA